MSEVPWASKIHLPDRIAQVYRPIRSHRCSDMWLGSQTYSIRQHGSRVLGPVVVHKSALFAIYSCYKIKIKLRILFLGVDIRQWLTFTLNIGTVPTGLSINGQTFGTRKSSGNVAGVAVVLHGIIEIKRGLFGQSRVTCMFNSRWCQAIYWKRNQQKYLKKILLKETDWLTVLLASRLLARPFSICLT